MINRQAGTRGLSAGDWTRLKRIQGANPVPTTAVSQSVSVSIPGNAPPTNSAGATAFVLACIDPRFASALEAFLAEELSQPGFFTYDLFILAGASLGGTLTGPGTPNGPPNTNNLCAVVSPSPSNNWRATLLDHIQAAITLHNVTSFYVIDHLDCGAFKVCDNAGDDLVPGPHEDQYTALKAIIDAALFYPNGGGAKVAGSTIFPNWTGLYFDIPVNSLTSLRDYATNTEQQVEVFPPTSDAKVLVLGCIDPRFNAALSAFLVDYKEVQFIYDLFILAGASLGVNQSYNTNGTLRANATTGTAYPNNSIAPNPGRSGVGPLGRHWGPTFFDHLSIARLLHNITQVWVFDHLDCGAYKLIKLNNGQTPLVLPPDNDIQPHIAEIEKLRNRINTYTSTTDYLNNPPTTLGFKGFVMDMTGNIKKVIDNVPGSPEPIKFGSSRIRNPSSDYTDMVARRSADFVTQSQDTSSLTPSLTVTRICSCTSTPLHTKLANCALCKNGF
jgi:carbonic anhydrase